MHLDSRFVKLAHDPGDPVLCSHCPFCGSGQITGRSDGGIDCAFCGQSFIVRVQPAFPGMPQAPGMGAPTDVGPDMSAMPPPGMEGEEGMPPGAEGGEGPPFGEEGEEGGPPGEEEEEEGGEENEEEGAPPFPPKKKAAAARAARAAGSRYRTLAGDILDEDNYVRHLALMHSGMAPAVLRLVRRSAAAKGGPEYNRHYNRGWRASQNWSGSDPAPLERADMKGEPGAWYDGYMDYAVDRPKFHSRDCPAGDHEQPGCTLVDAERAG
jgi:hypothetical protein